MQVIHEREPVRVRLIGGPGDGEYMTIARLSNGEIPQTVAFATDISSGTQMGHTYYHKFCLHHEKDVHVLFYHTDMNEAEILPKLIKGYSGTI